MLQRVAPGRCGGIYVGHTAERPEHDAVGGSADLAAGQGVAELMQKHDEKEREVLKDVPKDRGVTALAALNLIDSDQEPGPVEI